MINGFLHVRTSENIFLILPSLPQVESAVLEAQSWISRSQPYLSSSVHDGDESGSLLKVDGLQVHNVFISYFCFHVL